MPQNLDAHPLAAIFPMLPDDELHELADDIRQNGLKFPIVVTPLDGKDVIVDGRNRYAACKIADVVPTFTTLNGKMDVGAFIISANVRRRHMGASQLAMAVAMIYPEGEQGRGRNAEARKAAASAGFSATRLKQARTVLRFSADLAQRVLAGMSLDEALRIMKGTLSDADLRDIRLAELRKSRPDLANKVDKRELTLEAAESQARDEAARLKELRVQTTQNVIAAIRHFDGADEKMIASMRDNFDPDVAKALGQSVSADRLRHVAEVATALAALWDKESGS